MRNGVFRLVAVSSVLLFGCAGVWGAEGKYLSISGSSSKQAVNVGDDFEIVLEVRIKADHHIQSNKPANEYAIPTVVSVDASEGLSFGEPVFPKPHERTDRVLGKISEFNGTISVRVPVKVAGPVGGESAKVSGTLRYQACEDKSGRCFAPEVVKWSVDVGLGQANAEAGTENLDDGLVSGKYAALKASPTKEEVGKGDKFDVVLALAIKDKHHIQSNKPFSEDFIATTVTVEPVAGLSVGEAVFPAAHVHTDRILGKVAEFKGKIEIRVPVEVSGATEGEEVKLGGSINYQACDDKSGRCFPPESLDWSVELTSTSVAVAGSSSGESSDSGTPAGDGPTVTVVKKDADFLASLGLLGHLIGGFLGGLILNIMPCVLPVISIKILSFVQQADEEPKRVFKLGLTFAAGIIISFWILAAGILGLQHASEATRGWGSFFQEPAFIVAMIVVMFTFSLSLFGVFEVVLPGAASGKLAGATEKEGFTGAFMKGVLATLLATPCTAPFLAPAIAWALAQKGIVVFLVFSSAGLGMAAPYVLLTARPSWMKYMPKPGNWMVTFKQFMGFLLVGTVVWLFWVLGALLGESGVVWMLAFLAFLSLSCWLFGKYQFSRSKIHKAFAYWLAIASIVFGGWYAKGQYVPPQKSVAVPTTDNVEELARSLDWSAGVVPWVPYSKGLAERLAEAGYPVYVDYTARWCMTCQANKKLVFSNETVIEKMKSLGIVPVKADFTRYDEDIAEDLKRFGRDAVPLNIIVPAGKPESAVELPVVLTPGIVLDELKNLEG